MIAQTFLEIFLLDLGKLKEEVMLYKNESDLWVEKKEIKNSAGTLVLHLTGNLKHFIGAVLGNTGYIRQRDKEFSERNVPVKKLLASIDETVLVVSAVLSKLEDEDVMKAYPIVGFGKGKDTKTLYVITRLISHFNYHLGQVNYYRRLM